MPRTITVTFPVSPIPKRPRWLREFGSKLHPEVVTEAWYAAECPPNFKPEVPFHVRAQWRLACLLRGAR